MSDIIPIRETAEASTAKLSGCRLSIATGPADIMKGVACHLRYDVRHWANPHGQLIMRPKSGAHPSVQEWLIQQPKVAREVLDMVEEVRDEFTRGEGQWVSVGIYCKGGKHRSLMAAWTMAQVLAWSDVRSTIWRLGYEGVSADWPTLVARVHAEVQPVSFQVPALSVEEGVALEGVIATATWLEVAK